MKILVINVGSTSLKFKLYDMPLETVLCESRIVNVGSERTAAFYYKNMMTGMTITNNNCAVSSYSAGIKMFLAELTDSQHGCVCALSDINIIGFKTVLAKGYHGVHELTNEVIEAMREFLFVAPAHNGPYIEAIEQFHEIFPDAELVGVFETAFHTTIPLERRMYSIPYEWYEKFGIMRMGYHGASHAYVANYLAQHFGGTGRAISCHLGGSSSICAIESGKSVDTSFGFSLQSGIPHANRVGDIDPFIVPFLTNKGMDYQKVIEELSTNGGLQGMSGISNDLKEILLEEENGNRRAKLAVDVLVNSIIKWIGSFYAELGGLDYLVFTGGIGENASVIRARVGDFLPHLGVQLDHEKNCRTYCEPVIISADESPVTVMVIPANEELGIARATWSYSQNKTEIINKGM